MTEAELFKAGRAGDIKARNEFLMHYAWIPKWMIRKYGGLYAGREDMLQEGMMGLLLAWEKYDETRGANFATFARFYVWERFTVYLRYHLRHGPEFSVDPDQLENFGGGVTIATQERDAILSDRHRKLWRAIRRLPQSSRKCLLHLLLMKKKQPVLAKELGLTRQAINLRYHTAVEQLQEILHKRDYED